MNINYNNSNGEGIITLEGEMDARGCSDIRRQLEDYADTYPHHRVSLDMSNISYLDSSGISVIVLLYKQLNASGGAMKIVGVQGQPRQLLELLRIGNAIEVHAAPQSPATEGCEPCIG